MPRPVGEDDAITIRRRWVMNERCKFKSLDDIHQEWNATYPEKAVSRTTIAKDIKESVADSVREVQLATLEWRQLHIQRIEAVLANKKFRQKLEDGDLWTVDRFDKLMEKLIKLTGAYMPMKVAQTDPSGEKMAESGLSDEERATRIKELLDRAAQRQQKALGEEEEAQTET